MTTTAILTAALDAPDLPEADTALLLIELADWLEESGDPHAAGLRLVGERRPYHLPPGPHGWRNAEERGPWAPDEHDVPPDVFHRLPADEGRSADPHIWHAYRTRSAALLALAEALAAQAAQAALLASVCVWTLPPSDGPLSPLGATLEDDAAYLAGVLPEGWSLDGAGYLTVACDGVSPEACLALGCRPAATGRVW